LTLLLALALDVQAADMSLPVVFADEGRLAKASDPFDTSSRPDVIELAAESIQGVLAVPVTLGHSRSALFLVDTGAQLGVIGRSVLSGWGLPADVGLPLPASGSGGGSLGDLRVVGLDRVGIGERTLVKHPIAVSDLSGLGQASGREIGGILGHTELAGYVVEFDSEAPAVRWFSPDAFASRSAQHDWKPIPATFHKEIVEGAGPSVVLVDAVVDGVGAKLLLDTGCAWSAVSTEVARKAGWKVEPSARKVVGVDGARTAGKARGTLVLGDLVIERADLVVTDDLSIAEGRLCMDAFEGRHLAVDYPSRRVLVAD
jgi:hypothetical protein